MSRSPTGHGFWMPASIGGDARLASATSRCDERIAEGSISQKASLRPAAHSSGLNARSNRLRRQAESEKPDLEFVVRSSANI
jgi:hypothetical protein